MLEPTLTKENDDIDDNNNEMRKNWMKRNEQTIPFSLNWKLYKFRKRIKKIVAKEFCLKMHSKIYAYLYIIH